METAARPGDHDKPCTVELIRKSTETKQMEKVSHLEALLFSAVLENCVDQLEILGYIMPVPHKDKTDLSHSSCSCSSSEFQGGSDAQTAPQRALLPLKTPLSLTCAQRTLLSLSWWETSLCQQQNTEKEQSLGQQELSFFRHRLRLIDLLKTGIQEMKQITETQKELDINDTRQGSGETVPSTALKNTEHKQQLGKTEDQKNTHHPSERGRKHSALPADKLRKIQADRQYASDVITVTMKNMQESGIFNSLTEANEREKEKKSKFYDILIREETGKKEIKSLQKQLQDVKRQTERDLQNRDKIIDRLKEKLQERTAKLHTESSYMRKNTDLQVHQTQKKCSNEENALDKEIQNLRSKMDEENQLHTVTENFLKRQYQRVEEKLEYWMEKYENDTGAKDEELDDLKALKAENLETMQQFAKECLTFEETIITDRSEKEAKRKQGEQDALELRSILKLQAWWKGMMVRRFLGPYQALEKLLKEQPPAQKTGKETSGAKKRK